MVPHQNSIQDSISELINDFSFSSAFNPSSHFPDKSISHQLTRLNASDELIPQLLHGYTQELANEGKLDEKPSVVKRGLLGSNVGAQLFLQPKQQNVALLMNGGLQAGGAKPLDYPPQRSAQIATIGQLNQFGQLGAAGAQQAVGQAGSQGKAGVQAPAQPGQVRPGGIQPPDIKIPLIEQQLLLYSGASGTSGLQRPPLAQDRRQQIQELLGEQESALARGRRAIPRKKESLWDEASNTYLREITKKNGAKNWVHISQQLKQQFNKDFKADAVCQHYHRVLNSNISHEKWTESEDERLVQAVLQCQKGRWREIAGKMENRTDVQVRARLERLKTKLIAEGRLSEDYLP